MYLDEMIEVKKAAYQGLVLPDFDIGLDVGTSFANYVFTSHAHADHMPKRNDLNVYCTRETDTLIRQRGFRGKSHLMHYEEWVEFEGFRAQLLPAGHILGSAMVHIESDLGSLLYTGDYRFPASPTSGGITFPKQVDIFITEATFALPIYRWKSHELLFEQLRNEALVALEEGKTPIFLAYSLGKTQELLAALAPLGKSVQVHSSAIPLCQIYEEFGVDLGKYEPYNRATVEGNMLVCTHQAWQTGTASHVKKPHIIYVSGWATMEARRAQLGADAMIPLSDHIDFFELLNCCKKLSPKKIWITHTPDPSVMIHFLKEEGFDVVHLDIDREEDPEH